MKNDLHSIAQELGRSLEAARIQWQAAFKPFIDNWNAPGIQLSKVFIDLHEQVSKLPEHIKVGGKLLAERGWYLDHEFPIGKVKRLREHLEQGNEEAVDKFMCTYFCEALPALKVNLSQKYPHRTLALNAALDALANKQPVLAIPILLAQSDGICSELLGAKLFQKEKGRPLVAKKIEALNLDDASGVFLSVLSFPGGVAASTDFRDKYPHCLNRHEILHGLDSTYGTEINGWKALSLLSFVGLLAPSALRSEAS